MLMVTSTAYFVTALKALTLLLAFFFMSKTSVMTHPFTSSFQHQQIAHDIASQAADPHTTHAEGK